MAKFKPYSYEQQLIIPVSLSNQVLSGTFEYTLNTLIDKKLDLSIFNEKYKNDVTGAGAYDPARDSLVDHPVCVFQSHKLQPENGKVLPGKYCLHGSFR